MGSLAPLLLIFLGCILVCLLKAIFFFIISVQMFTFVCVIKHYTGRRINLMNFVTLSSPALNVGLIMCWFIILSNFLRWVLFILWYEVGLRFRSWALLGLNPNNVVLLLRGSKFLQVIVPTFLDLPKYSVLTKADYVVLSFMEYHFNLLCF